MLVSKPQSYQLSLNLGAATWTLVFLKIIFPVKYV